MVSMMPVGVGNGDDGMGHLYQPLPVEFTSAWGLHAWEWWSCWLRLAHGLCVPEQRAETSCTTWPADLLKIMGLSTLVGLGTSLEVYSFASSLCHSFSSLTSNVSSPSLLVVSALGWRQYHISHVFCICDRAWSRIIWIRESHSQGISPSPCSQSWQ